MTAAFGGALGSRSSASCACVRAAAAAAAVPSFAAPTGSSAPVEPAAPPEAVVGGFDDFVLLLATTGFGESGDVAGESRSAPRPPLAPACFSDSSVVGLDVTWFFL